MVRNLSLFDFMTWEKHLLPQSVLLGWALEGKALVDYSREFLTSCLINLEIFKATCAVEESTLVVFSVRTQVSQLSLVGYLSSSLF